MTARDTYKKGFIELLLLALLSEGDKYGYQLSQEIMQRSEDAVRLPEGSLYPSMYRLVEAGFVSDRKVQVKKRMTRVYYHLEPSGRERLSEMLSEYEIFSQGLARLMSSIGKGGEET